jgi:hypothetical protein
VFANAIRIVEDECIVRTKVVVTGALPLELRGGCFYGADHEQGIKFRVATRSGKNFQSGIGSFWNSIRHTVIEC